MYKLFTYATCPFGKTKKKKQPINFYIISTLFHAIQ